jgi:hypothetical protein
MATATSTPNMSAENLRNKASDVAANVADKAKDTAAGMADKAKEAVTGMADKAKQAASSLGQRAEDATHSVGSGMKNLGETIRDRGPSAGIAGSATSSVAQALESGGQYLEQEGLQGMAQDMTNLIRRNPIPALLVGIGLGFVLARATMRR